MEWVLFTPKQVSAAISCKPTPFHTHDYFDNEVYRSSQSVDLATVLCHFSRGFRICWHVAPPLREVKGMSQPSCVSSCDTSRSRRAGGRRRGREKLFPLSFIKSHAKMLQSLLTFSIFFPVQWPSYNEKYVLKLHYWNVLNNDCQGWKLATRMNVIYSSVLQRGP